MEIQEALKKLVKYPLSKGFQQGIGIAIGTAFGGYLLSLFFGLEISKWLWDTFVRQNWLLWIILIGIAVVWVARKAVQFIRTTSKTLPDVVQKVSSLESLINSATRREEGMRSASMETMSNRVSKVETGLAELATKQKQDADAICHVTQRKLEDIKSTINTLEATLKSLEAQKQQFTAADLSPPQNVAPEEQFQARLVQAMLEGQRKKKGYPSHNP